MTLSVCMIVKNEEKFLPMALASIKDLAEQIVVIDTGSTDSTIEIAQNAGAEVIPLPWPGDFAAARNVSLEHATQEWILVLDADEYLAPGTVEAIKHLINRNINLGYESKIRNFTKADDIANSTEHYVLRLFPNKSYLRYIGLVHEQLVSTDHNNPLRRSYCPDLLILHAGYLPEVMKAKNKSERNKALLLQAIEKEPMNGFHYFNLARTHQALGSNHEALEAVERCIQISSPEAAYLVPAISQRIALTLDIHGPLQACGIAMAAPQKCFDNPDYWIVRAGVHQSAGDYQGAIDAYEKAAQFVNQRSKNNTPFDNSSMTWKPYYGIAQCWSALGHPETALIFVEQSIKQCPKNAMAKDLKEQILAILPKEAVCGFT